jgi:polysaccharide deacetylase family protein (PEP-CTERM system associated)
MSRDTISVEPEINDRHIAGWHNRPVITPFAGHKNAITIDVEDYYQVEAFFSHIDRNDWDTLPSRIERNVHRILDILAASDVKATFFTLSWIAKRYPTLVERLVKEGHELASHGSEHRRADSQTPHDFALDVGDSKKYLEDLAGVAVRGYRAPSFSIGKANLWSLEVLAAAGYQYSSSIYPVLHDNYGIPDAPRFAFRPLPGDDFIEIPVTSVRLAGRNWPCGGGGYFRLMPYAISAAAIKRVNTVDKQSCIFYFHPWEMDPGQPRIAGASLKSRFRHELNLHKMEDRIAHLLAQFSWGRMDEIFLDHQVLRDAA